VKVVVVLGGGGAKALAHAGAWRAVRDIGASVTHLVGTSMGAVLAAAFAAGSNADRVLATASALTRRDVAALDPWAFVKGVFADSLLEPAALRRTIARLVPATRFDELEIPLTITATDVDTGELVLFGAPVPGPDEWAGILPVRHLGVSAPLQEALYASCALPLYFPAAELEGARLVDGGLRAVLPLAVAARIPADVVLAVSVGPGFDEPAAPVSRGLFPPALIRAHGEAIRVMMAAETARAIAAWPPGAPPLVLVRAVAERESTFAMGQSDRYAAAGYEATRRAWSAALDAAASER